MKRRRARERDEAAAREQAERRTEDLLAQLKGREAAVRGANDGEGTAPSAQTVPDEAE